MWQVADDQCHFLCTDEKHVNSKPIAPKRKGPLCQCAVLLFHVNTEYINNIGGAALGIQLMGYQSTARCRKWGGLKKRFYFVL